MLLICVQVYNTVFMQYNICIILTISSFLSQLDSFLSSEKSFVGMFIQVSTCQPVTLGIYSREEMVSALRLDILTGHSNQRSVSLKISIGKKSCVLMGSKMYN